MALSTHLSQVQTRINTLLAEQIQASQDHAPDLKEAMHYVLLMGGKRMRPFLVYATGEMLGVAQQDLDAPAMAVECIHTYSLVHDDLPAMDNDDMRRGQPTCHIAFDEATAILAGDALQSLAFDILAGHKLNPSQHTQRLSMVRQLASAAGYHGMCGGQAMDLAATNKAIDQQQLQALHNKKTGALISVSMTMAATLADTLPPEHLSQLACFADTIGLAFQVQDDILDVVGDSQVLGKPQGSDQAANKSTYPALLGLEGAKTYLSNLHQQALQALHNLPYNTQVLQSFADYTIQRDH